MSIKQHDINGMIEYIPSEEVAALQAENEKLLTLAASRAGDYAELLAENARLKAERDLLDDYRIDVENYYPLMDFETWRENKEARVAREEGMG